MKNLKIYGLLVFAAMVTATAVLANDSGNGTGYSGPTFVTKSIEVQSDKDIRLGDLRQAVNRCLVSPLHGGLLVKLYGKILNAKESGVDLDRSKDKLDLGMRFFAKRYELDAGFGAVINSTASHLYTKDNEQMTFTFGNKSLSENYMPGAEKEVTTLSFYGAGLLVDYGFEYPLPIIKYEKIKSEPTADYWGAKDENEFVVTGVHIVVPEAFDFENSSFSNIKLMNLKSKAVTSFTADYISYVECLMDQIQVAAEKKVEEKKE